MRVSTVLYQVGCQTLGNSHTILQTVSDTNDLIIPAKVAGTYDIRIPETHPLFNVNIVTQAIFNSSGGSPKRLNRHTNYVNAIDRMVITEIADRIFHTKKYKMTQP